MDKRSWPWKKKSSDKQTAEKAAATPSDSSTTASDATAAQVDKVCRYHCDRKSFVLPIT